MTPTEVVLAYIDAVNSQSIDKLVGLLTPDHTFTDSLGKKIPGRRHMRDAWLGYFKNVPDYRITVTETFEEGDRVMIVGVAGGTYRSTGLSEAEERWEIPAAWRGKVDGHRLAEWAAFVDHGPLRLAILRAGAAEPA